MNGIQEVSGSIPLISTKKNRSSSLRFFSFFQFAKPGKQRTQNPPEKASYVWRGPCIGFHKRVSSQASVSLQALISGSILVPLANRLPVLVHLVEHLAAGGGDEDEVFDPDAEFAGEIDAGLD